MGGVSFFVTGGLVNSPLRFGLPAGSAGNPPLENIIMNDKYIRDGTGKIIGYPDGQYIKDRTGRILGKHSAADDYTRDRTGKIIGKGDQRLRLLGKP